VTCFFIQLAQEHGESCIEGTLIKIHLTQQEIASAVGASRVLQELIRSEHISRKKRYYVLKNEFIKM
jgi:CRP/FNR family transcriptional regulator, cyclic AMP receptor protein